MRRFRSRQVLGREDGISLIEVIIAMFVIAVGMMALASTSITSVQTTRVSRERQDATQLASRMLEEMRSYPYEWVALDTSEYDMSIAGNASYDGESVHAAVDGAVTHEVVSGPLTARTWVTWTDAVAQDEKRVTTVVTWSGNRRDREVRQSTLVTDARRGLPVPNFQLTPATSSKVTVPGEVVCFDHTLTNLGEQDSYSWKLLRLDGNGNWVDANARTRSVVEDGITVTREGFDVPDNSGPGKGWFAWARMGPTVSTLSPMVDLTSDGRPDSTSPVARRADAIARVCYTPNDASGSLRSNGDPTPQFTLRMHSAFDENVQREVVDQLTVNSTTYRMNLHHVYKNGVPEPDNRHKYNLLMDREPPIGTTENADYDRDGVNGLLMPGTAGARFYWQNIEGTSRTLDAGDAPLSVSVATASSLAGAPAGTLTVTATVSRDPGTGATTDLGSSTTTLTPNASAWTLLLDQIPLVSAVIAQNEYLRLELSCVTETGEACHIHYDVAGVHPSSLEVTLQ